MSPTARCSQGFLDMSSTAPSEEPLALPDIKFNMSRLEEMYPDPRPSWKEEKHLDCFGGCTNPQNAAKLDAQFLESVFIQLFCNCVLYSNIVLKLFISLQGGEPRIVADHSSVLTSQR